MKRENTQHYTYQRQTNADQPIKQARHGRFINNLMKNGNKVIKGIEFNKRQQPIRQQRNRVKDRRQVEQTKQANLQNMRHVPKKHGQNAQQHNKAKQKHSQQKQRKWQQQQAQAKFCPKEKSQNEQADKAEHKIYNLNPQGYKREHNLWDIHLLQIALGMDDGHGPAQQAGGNQIPGQQTAKKIQTKFGKGELVKRREHHRHDNHGKQWV